MAAMQSYTFEGKELGVWSEDQLSRLNRGALKQRARDIRDHVGQDRLSPMPHHPEALMEWILTTQDTLMGRAEQPSKQLVSQGRRSQAGGVRNDMGDTDRSIFSGRPTSPAGSVYSEGMAAYHEASMGARAAAERNRGSQIF